MTENSDSKRRYHWFLTENNFDENSPLLRIDEVLDDNLRYVKLSSEIGETGTPHLHAYICLHRNQRFSYLKKLFPRAHIQPRLKSHDEVKAYVGNPEKDGQVLWIREFGSDKGVGSQGFRSDLDRQDVDLWEIKNLIDSGASVQQLYDDYFPLMVRLPTGLFRYIERHTVRLCPDDGRNRERDV